MPTIGTTFSAGIGGKSGPTFEYLHWRRVREGRGEKEKGEEGKRGVVR
jgi:hypothetical protein